MYVYSAAQVESYLVTKIYFGQIGLMCTKVVSHHTTIYTLELFHLA